MWVTCPVTSSLVKLYHFGRVKLGLEQGRKGSDNYIRFGMRIGAVVLPFLIAGLNDHMPGDYCQQVVNSDPAAWQPFKSQKKLSRWANAVMFTRALARSGSSTGHESSDTTSAGNTAAASTAAVARSGSSAAAGRGGHMTLSSKLQAMLVQHADGGVDGSRSTADAVKTSPRGAAAGNGAIRRVAFSAGGAYARKVGNAAAEAEGGDGHGVADASAKGSVAAAAKLWGRVPAQ